MASRIPGIAAPGQQIGSVRTRTTPQPFQRINAPVEAFGIGQAKTLEAISKGLDGVQEWAAGIDQDNADALLLKVQGQMKTERQARENGWSAPATDQNGVPNQYHATGELASRDWAKQSSEDFEKIGAGVRESDEYKKLSIANQRAIDKWIQDEEVAHRGRIMEHHAGQSKANYKARVQANTEILHDSVVSNAQRPVDAQRDLTGIAGVTIAENGKEGRAANDTIVFDQVRGRITPAVEAAVTSILGDVNDPHAAQKAKDFLAMNGTIKVQGQEFSIDPAVRDKLEGQIEATKVGAQARTIGDELFSKHGQDNEAAYQALLKKNLPEPVITAAQAHYQKRAGDNKAQVAHERAEHYRRVSIAAGQGQKPSDADLDALPMQQRQAVEAEWRYRDRVAKYGGAEQDDHAVKRSWMGMSEAERAGKSQVELYDEILSKMTPDTADEILNEWRDAKASQGTLDKTEAEKAAKLQRSATSLARKEFTGLLDAKLDAVLPSSSDKDEKAAMKYVLLREFGERNRVKPMTLEEMDSFLNSATTRILLDGDTGFLGATGGTFLKQGGKQVTQFDKITGALAQIPPEDRFDVMRWYLKQNPDAVDAEGAVDTQKVNEWLNENYLGITVQDMRASPQYSAIKREIERKGVTETDALVEQMYRKWMREVAWR